MLSRRDLPDPTRSTLAIYAGRSHSTRSRIARWLVPFVLVIGLLALPGCFGDDANDRVTVTDAWARPESQGANSAAYMTLRNTGDTELHLSGASADIAAKVEIHKSFADTSGMMKMEQVESVAIGPGAEVELKPGGFHVMFMGLQRDLNLGDHFTLTLTFSEGGEQEVDVVVKQPQAQASQTHAHR